MKLIWKYGFLLLVTLFVSGCTFFDEPVEQSSAELVEVVDGDTIRIIWNGKEETVRYLLVDTPETNHPRLGKQPFGEEAKLLNAELLEGKELTIELDIGNQYDDYGRLLAYVYADGERVQDALIAAGLARVAYVYPPSTRHLDALEAEQQEAREQGIGIWEYDYYVTDRGFDAASYDQQGSECMIKGNINRQGEKIYHVPDGRFYSQTNPEEWFCSEQEARDAGFRKSQQ
ncbi:micrococcal nuclease [Chryseomicrobium aureum]|uniref:thermonuclease family protein n=1 Tax=Chryseomicrobium aureum TaxID=1441723 RepID=UPI001958DADD|nr:thermonuclease family protein [Chryseomicrobium aureum]MBM7705239.1 micrococcal nuclease [Chryseomicrobium aureum]